MRKSIGLFQPVKQTEEMKLEAFETYESLKKNQVGQTSPMLMKWIKEDFYTHLDVEREKLDALWNFVSTKLVENDGLAQFTLDYYGALSQFFFPWLVSVATSPSEALEMSYGWGYDLAGNWSFAGSDEIEYFVQNDPTFVYNRERQLCVADLVTRVREVTPQNRKSRVVDLGAGRMAWARYHGFKFEPERQEIWAFDRDTSINPETLFLASPESLGLHYETYDIMTAIKEKKFRAADLVILGGVASYYPKKLFEEQVVMPIYHLLADEGSFFFDIQLDCPYYRRSVEVFDWPRMQLASKASEAIDSIEEMRRRLWRRNLKFDADYSLDTYNGYPTSVMVTITKI